MSISSIPVELERTELGARRHWAVLEIRADGSPGRAEVVSSTGPEDALRATGAMTAPGPALFRSAAFASRVGLLQAAMGYLPEAARSFLQGTHGPSGVRERRSCLEHLALVEAVQGDLRRAEVHARPAGGPRGVDNDGAYPVHVAR
ncbi:MAG: hypothetical protein JWR85_3438, partial [Marmoricola sp.]|nr:hypothetical protein [Marmoricola sp.]